MNNYELAAIFDRIADLLEIKGEVIYKTLAYRKAADSLRDLAEDINRIHAAGGLMDVPGVGRAIAEKIDELLTTGHLGFLEKLETEVPATLVELLQVPDVGPKKARMFWQQAGITSLAELEAAARGGKLRDLPGMGEKSEQRILEGLAALSRRSHRMMLGNAVPIAERWLEFLRALPQVKQAEAAGSLRRRRETVGDLDIVVATDDPAAVMQAFTGHHEVLRVKGQGENKSSVELISGLNIQVWTQPPERFGALLQFVTGSKDHNVRLRELAQKRGLSLSERGFVDEAGVETPCASETDVYATLGLPLIPPELREDRGEIQSALKGGLPNLIRVEDIAMELHAHTTWSDGVLSVEQLAEQARSRGFRVIAVTDHSYSLGIVNGLTPERLREQRVEIEAARRKFGDSITILQGVEMEIRADGELDFTDDVLAELDIVIASLHVSLRQPKEVVTSRLLKAIRNPHVDIIGHPSGRLLPNREGADLDWDAVFEAASQSGIALEINAHPSRLDLTDVHAKRASGMGIPISIDTDAHSPADFDMLRYGVSVARRAWMTPDMVINTWETDKFLAWLRARDKG